MENVEDTNSQETKNEIVSQPQHGFQRIVTSPKTGNCSLWDLLISLSDISRVIIEGNKDMISDEVSNQITMFLNVIYPFINGIKSDNPSVSGDTIIKTLLTRPPAEFPQSICQDKTRRNIDNDEPWESDSGNYIIGPNQPGIKEIMIAIITLYRYIRDIILTEGFNDEGFFKRIVIENEEVSADYKKNTLMIRTSRKAVLRTLSSSSDSLN